MSNLLYHGSDGGIIRNLSLKVGVELKDFGRGFYNCQSTILNGKI